MRSPLRLFAIVIVAALCTACTRPDADVQQDLQQQLNSDSVTAPAHLSVTVQQGVAHLAGETETMAQQTRAVDLARGIKGVKDVQSDIRMNDATLTRDVQAAIAADPEVSAIPLRIEVVKGEVRLMSDQTNATQRAKLVADAKAVAAVVHVEDRMK
jgi:hyperosmotically inducible protein